MRHLRRSLGLDCLAQRLERSRSERESDAGSIWFVVVTDESRHRYGAAVLMDVLRIRWWWRQRECQEDAGKVEPKSIEAAQSCSKFHFYYLFPNFLSKPTNPPSFLTHFRMINWRAPQESGSLPNTPLKAAITTTQRRTKENNEKKKKNPNKPMSKIPKSYGVDWLLCGFKV